MYVEKFILWKIINGKKSSFHFNRTYVQDSFEHAMSRQIRFSAPLPQKVEILRKTADKKWKRNDTEKILYLEDS